VRLLYKTINTEKIITSICNVDKPSTEGKSAFVSQAIGLLKYVFHLHSADSRLNDTSDCFDEFKQKTMNTLLHANDWYFGFEATLLLRPFNKFWLKFWLTISEMPAADLAVS